MMSFVPSNQHLRVRNSLEEAYYEYTYDVEDTDLQALLDKDDSHTHEQFAKKLSASHRCIFKCLHATGKI